jgi:nucleotidyltransferase substrate binding protein (TIGR01987 family)
MNLDIRWQQRFQNFEKAFNQLKFAVELANERTLSELEKQGLIQAFEFTHELAWKTMKNFLESKGQLNIYGSKDTSRLAYNLALISNGEIWMDMINSRNLSSLTYDEETADAIMDKIVNNYFEAFENFHQTMIHHKTEQ